MLGFKAIAKISVAIALTNTALAQTVDSDSLGSVEQLRQLQQQRWLEQTEREQQRSQPGLALEPPSTDTPVADHDPELACVSVRTVAWLGSPEDRQALFEALAPIPWMQHLPACLSAPAIERRIATLNKQLQTVGLITSRIMPAQPVWQDGILRLRLVAGRIDAYQKPPDLPAAMLRDLFPAVGAVLNLRQLEQSLDIVNRLRSFRLRLSMLPGASPGTTTIALQLQRSDALQLRSQIDNSGSEQLGVWRWQLGASWDAPLGRGWLLSASASGDLESRGEDAAFASRQWHLDYARGRWHFDWDAVHSRSSQRLSGLPIRVLSETEQSLYQARLTRLLYRDHRWLWRAGLRVEHGNTRYRLAGRRLSHSGAASNLAADVSALRYVKGGYWQGRLERQWGQSWWGVDSDPLASGPDPGYRRWRLQLSALQQLPRHWLWQGQLLWQSTEDRLPSAQQLSMGGQQVLKSYNSGVLAGDKGLWMSHLLRGPQLAESGLRWQLNWDWGRLRDRTSGWRSASSAGVGLLAKGAKDDWQLSYHHRLHGPDSRVTDNDQWRFQWQRLIQ